MRRRIVTLLFLALTIVGLGMRFYPAVADWWNDAHQSRAVASYAEAVASMDRDRYEEVLASAQEYNARLAKSGILWTMDAKQEADYYAQLDVTGLGVMAYLDIPKIDVTLPIYHGTSNDVLQVGVGHLAGTSLPVGGTGTHCSVSAHRGLPSARLFTDLGQLVEGDRFTVTALDQKMTYEVDQIRIVLPDELDDLVIDPDQDYVTLITCTPYGVNSHRMLVRGRRVANDPDEVVVLAEAVLLQPRAVAFVLALPLLLVLFVWMMASTGRAIRHKEALRDITHRFRLRREERERIDSEDEGPGDRALTEDEAPAITDEGDGHA